MTDLPPLDKCKVGKKGQHHLVFFCPVSKKGDITAVCDRCGSTRRMPASGPIFDDKAILEEAERILGA